MSDIPHDEAFHAALLIDHTRFRVLSLLRIQPSAERLLEWRRCDCGQELSLPVELLRVRYTTPVGMQLWNAEPVKLPAKLPSLEISRQFGLQLRSCREKHSLTRVRLAVLAGVGYSTLRNIETGRHIPTVLVLAKLQQVPELQELFPQESADEGEDKK